VLLKVRCVTVVEEELKLVVVLAHGEEFFDGCVFLLSNVACCGFAIKPAN
jgi:hypothetical protein